MEGGYYGANTIRVKISNVIISVMEGTDERIVRSYKNLALIVYRGNYLDYTTKTVSIISRLRVMISQ